MELAALPVVVEERLRLPEVHVHAVAHHVLAVVATALLGGAADQATNELVLLHLERHGCRERQALGAQQIVERRGLPRRAGETIQQHADGVHRRQLALDHGDDEIVGNQLPGAHDALGLAAEIGPVRHVRAQHVPRRQLPQAPRGRQPGGLRALARSRRTHEQDDLGPRRFLGHLEAPPTAADAALADEALVVAHHQLRLELPQGVESDTNHDEQAGAGEDERQLAGPGQPGEHLRQCVHSTQEERAPQCDPVGDARQVLRRRVPRSHPRHEATVLTEVVADPARIEGDLRVEVREPDDQQRAERQSLPVGRVEPRTDGLQPARVRERPDHRLREDEDRHREDDRDHAGRVEAQRDVGGLTAHHLASHDLARVLHRDATFGLLHEHHAGDGDDQQCQVEDQAEHIGLPLADERELLSQRVGEGRHDPGVDDERDAVADPVLGDLLTEPHHHRDASDLGDEHDEPEERSVGPADAQRAAGTQQGDGQEQGLDRAQRRRAVARVLRDLAPTLLALLAELLEGRVGRLQQLDDDARGDVGDHPERGDREDLEVAARDEVEEAEDRALPEATRLQPGDVDARGRDVHQQPVHGEQAHRDQQLGAQVRNDQRIAKGLEHA